MRSANGASPVRFCSYHAQTSVGGTVVSYVVQPWTATYPTVVGGCDDPGVPEWPNPPGTIEIATGAADRMVSPLSQAEVDARTDPALNGWYALDGSEMSDNGCLPLIRASISSRSAHIKTGRSSTVVIGRGTLSGIKNGTVKLQLRLARDMAKLRRLRHLKLTVRLSLTGATGDRATIDAAGSY